MEIMKAADTVVKSVGTAAPAALVGSLNPRIQ